MTRGYERLVELNRELCNYGSIGALLCWDQETNMPRGGAEARAVAMSQLSGFAHDLSISREYARALLRAERERLSGDGRRVVVELRRRYRRAAAIPRALVEEMAGLASRTHELWVEARRRSDFRMVMKNLTRIFELRRKEADLVGFEGHPYDALIDVYEPGMTFAKLTEILDGLRDPLIGLAKTAAATQGRRTGGRTFRTASDADRQSLCRLFMDAMGFDFQRGRIDRSAHPFSSGIHPTDVRITVRSECDDALDHIFSVLHETGHALYEQGLDASHWGTPLCETASLGIHESQSRMWENMVGRSRPFWRHFLPKLRRRFPRTFGKVGLREFLGVINAVRPSLIRVNADELTYNLHIILRFEIESSIVAGSMRVGDIPEVWNEKMREYLGVVPKTDAEGCLQDVHWYTCGIGYFPTYVLGNLYAAQFFAAWKRARPRWGSDLEAGRLTPLRDWLRKEIHARGFRLKAAELVKRVSGKSLDAGAFLDHLKERVADGQPGGEG